MPAIFPIRAVEFSDASRTGEVSRLIAPPYDVLDERSKGELLGQDEHNIVAVDLPHLPPKTVGPPETYARAGERFRKWLADGVLTRRDGGACYVYRQTYTVGGETFKRLGLIAGVPVRGFGENPDGRGAIRPHEQTFSSPKEDRLRLMEATRTQLSPIFGLYSDPSNEIHPLLNGWIEGKAASFNGTTAQDGVLHEVWVMQDAGDIEKVAEVLSGRDVFIADGHHRYNTALNYQQKLGGAEKLGADHPANLCMFVLVAMQDPGMIVLATHRALGGMADFSMQRFAESAKDSLKIEPFEGDVSALEAALPKAGQHAMGLVCREGAGLKLSITKPISADPLAATHGEHSEGWRQLDVAILQHLIVEGILEPTFCGADEHVEWKFPHGLDDLVELTDGEHYQLGVVMQPTPLDSVRRVSEAGELMPQKSTFFYPKLATGLAMHALE